MPGKTNQRKASLVEPENEIKDGRLGKKNTKEKIGLNSAVFCRNGYFLLLGKAGIRDSDSELSITGVTTDSTILTRKLLLLICKRSNHQDAMISPRKPVKKQEEATGERCLN